MLTQKTNLQDVVHSFIFMLLLSTQLRLVNTTGSPFCNENFSDKSTGRITSPFYPQNYGRNSNCTYKIIATSGEEITLNIEHLSIKEGSDCFDHLKIYQVIRGNRPKLAGNLCAASIAELDTTRYVFPPTTPEPNVVLIRFTSDYSDQHSGFSIAFTINFVTSLPVIVTTVAPFKSVTSTILRDEPVAATITTTSTVPTLRTAARTERTSESTTARTTARTGAASTLNPAMIISEKDKDPPQNISTILAILSVALGVLLIVCIVVFVVVARKRKRMPTPQTNVVFQNLTHEGNNEETDEYGRPRENTYVEIPLIPNEEPSSTLNGRLSTTLCRSASNDSIDSIVREKFEAALASQAERKSSAVNKAQAKDKESTEANGVYNLANSVSSEKKQTDLDSIYLQPSSLPTIGQASINSPTFELEPKFSFTENATNQVYTMADDNAEDGESSMSSKPSSLKADLVSSESCEIASSKKIDHVETTETQKPDLAEGIYNVPTSPPCDPPVTKNESFYDRPKNSSEIFAFPSSLKNKSELQNRRPSNVGAENKYCTMVGNLEQKSSPSNSISSSSTSNNQFEKIRRDSEYMPMMPQT